jgi:glycerophosphoryl diester phosphodiesterase
VTPPRHGLHPFLDEPPPVPIAHRGGAGEAPQNTLEAFREAVELGYLYLETDAHVTRDGVVVAFHDPCLDQITERRGAIADLSIEEVEAADAGYLFSADGGRSFPFRGRGVRIPRLEQLLRHWPEARFIVDPKTDACVDPLAAVFDKLDAWERVGIGSFSDRRLRRIRKLGRGRACTSMGPLAVGIARVAALFGRMPRLGADSVQVPLRVGPIPIVTAGFVRAAHRAGLPVHVWTIDDKATMHRLLDLGVDGIMTDRPRVLRDLLAAPGPEAQRVG